VLGIDDTIERRRGKRIAAKGIYRDPVRSSKSHFVKASGLRWLSLMLLAPIPWAGRMWALPFLTALAPSERYCRERGRRHKKLTDWARQMALQARRWLPGREIVLLGDSSFAALDFLVTLVRHGLTGITRLRLDAALYEPAPPRRPGTVGRPRTKGARLPNLSDVLVDETTCWQRLAVPAWYGERERVVEICSATAVWRHAGLPVLPIRPSPARAGDPCWTGSMPLASMGAAARPAATFRPAGPALHRSRSRPAADRPLVRPALAGGGHRPRGARPSRRRDPAPVVGAGDRPHHPLLARAVLDRDLARHAP
jgi:DDE superfamily endonuclease